MAARSISMFRHVPLFRTSVLICLVFVLCAAPSPSAAAPPEAADPTAILFRIRELFYTIEHDAAEAQWRKADETLGEISRLFYRIAPEPLDYKAKSLYQDFGAAQANFKRALEARDARAMEQFSIPLQLVFFDVMGDCDCPHPPALYFLDNDVERAVDALARENFDEIAHEIAEVAAFYPRVRVALVEKGVSESELEDCLRHIEDLQKIIAEKNRDQVKARLETLRDKVALFKGLYP